MSTLPNPLRAVVTLGATAQPGDTVTWATGASGASVTPLKSVTDANGVATTMWRLGHTAGTQTATATLSGATGSLLTFTAVATPGVATQIIQPTGDRQAWMVGTVLPKPLTVTVADQYGNGVSGLAIAWQVTSGSATVSPANAPSGTGGVAQTTVTLGNTPGPITITATNATLAGSPQSFSATAQPIPTSASVTVGAGIVFTSDRNSSNNPAVDTIAAGGTVTWTWAGGSHSVQSSGPPSFTSSAVQSTGSYSFTFTVAGTYHYDCAVHGASMSGTVVVR
ncbi:MAG TPA: plastocyanin/azurin family copper-binding protein [Gemmatimonadales bacterium]|nr:plastocyanin/azurin family copper-binding protein [Gemmatimonadales bacterium]